MKKIFILISMALALTACSSNGSDNKTASAPGTVTPFNQSIAGNWLSGCNKDDTVYVIENLTLTDHGTGSSTRNFYRDNACTINTGEPAAVANFAYQATGFANGATQVTVNFEGRPALTVGLKVEGNSLSLISAQGTVTYFRIGNVAGNTNDFNTQVFGVWVSEICSASGGNTSLQDILSIQDQGVASMTTNRFPSSNCSGAGRAEISRQINYTVTQFSNGQGQVVVDGQTQNIRIEGERLILTSQQGVFSYLRLRGN